MEKAYNRGRAKVLVDGVPARDDRHLLASPRHRSVVWTGTLYRGGAHRHAWSNAATPGRPRIDVDAVMIN